MIRDIRELRFVSGLAAIALTVLFVCISCLVGIAAWAGAASDEQCATLCRGAGAETGVRMNQTCVCAATGGRTWTAECGPGAP